ncbi:histone-lysine N-methyltransferase SMYD3-like [Panulirus ornatus]|uniref:histone-lysine N-methyltransferase SMYD3-like n=1 Tax=Panulirus ornatus TaxID=150431 RepID=UPI003A8C2D1D
MRDFVSLRAQALLAKKRVKRGDVLLTSKPFCTLLDASAVSCYCEYCLASYRKDRLLTWCKECGRACYCSDRCRELAEPLHRRECIVFRLKPHYKPKDFARFLARLIWKLKDGGDEIAEKIDEKRSRRFDDLESHSREIKDDREQMKYLDSLMPDLLVLVGKKNLPNREDLITIYGKVLVNSFCLLDDLLTPIGTSVYLAASIIDHSCAANAFVSFIGNKLVVRSLVDWPDLDWSRVRISYLDAMDCRQQRQDYLRHHYYFTCDCRMCRDDAHARTASTVPCGSPTCGAPVYIDETADGGVGPCDACGFKDFPDYLPQDYRRVAAYSRKHLKDLNEVNPELEVWKEVVGAQEGVMHPLNVLRAKATDALLSATLNLRAWHTAWGYAKQNHLAIRHYYGTKHPTYGLFLMKLGKIELTNMESRLALEHLEEAEEILEAGLGSNHPLVFYDLTWLLVQASEETRVEIQRSLMYGDHHPHGVNRGRS